MFSESWMIEPYFSCYALRIRHSITISELYHSLKNYMKYEYLLDPINIYDLSDTLKLSSLLLMCHSDDINSYLLPSVSLQGRDRLIRDQVDLLSINSHYSHPVISLFLDFNIVLI